MGSTRDGRGRPSKVAQLIDRYGLEGLGEELEYLWTTDDENERRSLRDLAEYFNRQLLEASLAEAGTQHVSGEVETIYRLLADDDTTSADRTRIERRLERDGIDVADLRSDFVSYQAIRTYLKSHRDAEYSPRDVDQVDSAGETIQQLRTRTAAVTESKLGRLRKGNEISLGDARVTVDVSVFCRDCDNHFDVGTLLDRGGCDCQLEETT